MFWLFLQVFLSVFVGVSIKIALNTGIEPINFSAIVFVFASLFIGVYAFFTKNFEFKNIGKNDVFKIILVGFIVGGLLNLTCFFAYNYTTLTNVAFLSQSSVMFSLLIGVLFLKEKRYFLEYAVLVLLFFGIYMHATSLKGFNISSGDMIVIVSALLYSIFLVGTQIIIKNVNPITFAFIRCILIGIFLFIYVGIFGKLNFDINYFWVILSGFLLGTTVIAFNKSLVNITASQMAIFNLLIPILTGIISYFIFGDKLNSIQIAGSIIIVFSVFILQQLNQNKLKANIND